MQIIMLKKMKKTMRKNSRTKQKHAHNRTQTLKFNFPSSLRICETETLNFASGHLHDIVFFARYFCVYYVCIGFFLVCSMSSTSMLDSFQNLMWLTFWTHSHANQLEHTHFIYWPTAIFSISISHFAKYLLNVRVGKFYTFMR